MFKLSYINYFIIAPFIFVGCQLDDIKINDWSPEVVIPLVNTTVTIADLIPEKGSTTYGEDGFISLAVSDDSVYVLTPESLIGIPNQIAIEEQFLFNDLIINDFVQDTIFTLEQIVLGAMENDPLLEALLPTLVEIPFPDQQEVVGTAFNLVNEELVGSINFELDDFESASFINGQLEIQITNNLPITIENVDIELGTGEGDIGLVQIINLLPTQTSSTIIDLANASIDNNIFANFLDLTLENVGADNVIITPETGFEIAFSITNINVDNITMTFDNQQLESDTSFFDFNLNNGEEIHNLVLSNGQINYSIESPLIAPIEATISIPSGSVNDVPFQVTELIQLNGDITNGSIDISGLMVDLTTDLNQPFNRVPLIFEIIVNSTNPITLNNSDYANIVFSFSDLKIDYLDGYFANYDIDLGGDTVDVDLGLFENFDSGLILENPTFSINFHNSFGLEANILGNLICYSQDETNSVGFNLNETIASPTNPDDNPFESSWSLAPNILSDMISLPPKRIEYTASASILDQGTLNFLTSDSRFLLGVDITCPLSLNAANISLHDTILFNQIDYDISKIDRLILHFNLINGFPLGTQFNLILHDSINMINLDTLNFIGLNSENNIIAPAVVDSEGELVESVLNSGILSLSSSEISNFLNANKIIIDINLNTSNSDNDNQYVKIYSHYKCVLKVGVETKIRMD